MWLPLLALFIGLAWLGWREYQKVAIFQAWEQQFDRAKYDILSVLGMKEDRLTWGVPSSKGILEYGSFELSEVSDIYLLVDDRRVDLDVKGFPKGKRFALLFERDTESNPENASNAETIRVPFTDVELAAKWGQFLQTARQG